MRTKTARKAKRPSRLPTFDPSPDDDCQRDGQAVGWGFSWLALGNIVNAACAWGRVALLARLGNVEMIGQLTLALAVCNPIDTLADMGLSGSLISDAKRQYHFRDYLGLRLLTCGLAMFVILVTARIGGYDPATARLVVLAGLVVVSESVCDLFQAVLQRREQMRWVAVSLMIRGVLGLAFFALGVRFGGNLACGVCGFSLAALTTLLCIDIPRALACERGEMAVPISGTAAGWDKRAGVPAQRVGERRPTVIENEMVGRRSLRDLVPPYNPSKLANRPHPLPLSRRERGDIAYAVTPTLSWWERGDTAHPLTPAFSRRERGTLGTWIRSIVALAWLSLPLGLATASLSLMTSLPRYWISGRLGNGALGGFAIAGSLMVAMSLVVGAMGQAASPRLARYHAAGDSRAMLRLLGSLSLWLAAATAISLLVMAIAGRLVIGLLFGPDYVSLAGVAFCLTLAAAFRNFAIFLGRAITSMRRFRTNLALRAVGIVALVLFLPGWINWLGMMGAAWALTLSWLVTVLLSAAVVLREVRRCRKKCGACAGVG